MPRESSPNSRANLKRGNKKTQFTVDNAVEMQKKSTESKHEKILLRDAIEKVLSEEDAEIIARNLVERAKENSKDFEVLRDSIGQKPVDKVEQINTDFVIDFGNMEGD